MSIPDFQDICEIVPHSCGRPVPPPGPGTMRASKEIVQLQTQVQQLQEQITAHEDRAFDERMGVMKNLVEQNTDAPNKTTAAINGAAADSAKAAGRLPLASRIRFQARSRR